MERIVVGFDGSEHARKALARAADIADGATVAVVSAANVQRLLRDPAGGVEPVDPADAADREKALGEAREYLEGRGITGVYIAGVGNAADVIVKF